MNKVERVKRALAAQQVDRPPFSFWYHFGLQHMPGEKHAEAELDFYEAFDLDFLKVMNDYPYPLPRGLGGLETADDWKRLEPLSADDPAWQEQLTALGFIDRTIGQEALFIDTIFSPWITARRLAPSGGLKAAMERYPDVLVQAMDAISTSLAIYAREAINRGAAGIFLSLGAATNDVMTVEEYAKWCRPFDLRILNAVAGAAFNVLHIHGSSIHFESLIDYPVNAFNWSHFSAGPGLAEGRKTSGKAVIGGVNEATASRISAPEVQAQAAESITTAGMTGLLLGPGCSIPTDTPVRNMRAIKAAAEGATVH